MHIFFAFFIVWNIRRIKSFGVQKIKGLHSAFAQSIHICYLCWEILKGGLFMGLFGGFGGANGNGCGCGNDCCDLILILFLLSSCGCGCNINLDCNTIIMLLLFSTLTGPNGMCNNPCH